LELSDNKLTAEDLKNLTKYKELRTLKFGNNLLKEMNDVTPLKDLPNLLNLDLTNNPVT